ncbi:hypothetical protein Tco_0775921 [Tanacetum coccineum]
MNFPLTRRVNNLSFLFICLVIGSHVQGISCSRYSSKCGAVNNCLAPPPPAPTPDGAPAPTPDGAPAPTPDGVPEPTPDGLNAEVNTKVICIYL